MFLKIRLKVVTPPKYAENIIYTIVWDYLLTINTGVTNMSTSNFDRLKHFMSNRHVYFASTHTPINKLKQ